MYFSKLILLIICLLLSGCKVELYALLTQQEGNEMYSLLMQNKLDVKKVPDKDGKIKILIEESQISIAIEILRQEGYPKSSFMTISDIFSNDSLITSPLEQAAKLNYVKSQELSQMLTEIDGVVSAKVLLSQTTHYNESENNNCSTPLSASIFIKFTQGSQLDNYSNQIKSLIKNSINGLNEKNISIVFFPTIERINTTITPELISVLELQFTRNSLYYLIIYLSIAIFGFTLSHFFVYLYWKRVKNK